MTNSFDKFAFETVQAHGSAGFSARSSWPRGSPAGAGAARVEGPRCRLARRLAGNASSPICGI